jgi:hypothetical protein
METAKKKKISVKPAENESKEQPQRKSPIVLFWEKYPNGIGEIINMQAVLK